MYFQEHSEGIYERLPKEIEMQQLLDTAVDWTVAHRIGTGATSLYWLGRDIHASRSSRHTDFPTASEITAAVNKSRRYIDKCIKQTA